MDEVEKLKALLSHCSFIIQIPNRRWEKCRDVSQIRCDQSELYTTAATVNAVSFLGTSGSGSILARLRVWGGERVKGERILTPSLMSTCSRHHSAALLWHFHPLLWKACRHLSSSRFHSATWLALAVHIEMISKRESTSGSMSCKIAYLLPSTGHEDGPKLAWGPEENMQRTQRWEMWSEMRWRHGFIMEITWCAHWHNWEVCLTRKALNNGASADDCGEKYNLLFCWSPDKCRAVPEAARVGLRCSASFMCAANRGDDGQIRAAGTIKLQHRRVQVDKYYKVSP